MENIDCFSEYPRSSKIINEIASDRNDITFVSSNICFSRALYSFYGNKLHSICSFFFGCFYFLWHNSSIHHDDGVYVRLDEKCCCLSFGNKRLDIRVVISVIRASRRRRRRKCSGNTNRKTKLTVNVKLRLGCPVLRSYGSNGWESTAYCCYLLNERQGSLRCSLQRQ